MTKAAATFFLRNFAAALLDGEWKPAAIQARARRAWPRNAPRKSGWLRYIRGQFPEKPPFDSLVAWLTEHPRYYAVLVVAKFEPGVKPSGVKIFLPLPQPGERTAPVADELPAIANFGQLAQYLRLTPGQLTVYADVQRLNRRRPFTASPRNPYRYRLVSKRSIPRECHPVTPVSAGFWQKLLRPVTTETYRPTDNPTRDKVRLLEIPKPRLMRAQRRILDDILALLPVHQAAHGFVPGRSILTNAALHTGREVIIRFDLRDFFPSVPATRVRGVFAKLGYSQSVSRLLMGLCTTVCSEDIDATEMKFTDLCDRPHLPQGAPTSPALANLCAYRLDCRLAGLAVRFGATYTRYADDLTFSGDHELRRTAQRLRKWVVRIVTEEGFTLNAAKTRVKSRSDRQTVTGLVVNVKPNVRRKDFDTLKAILTNCVRHGPASQNRDKLPHFRDHLLGRVAFVASVHPAHGLKLRAIFERIAWPASA